MSARAAGRSRVEILLVVAIVVVVGLRLSISEDDERRNFEFLPDMVDSPAHRAQDANRVFTEAAPPEGAIARGYPALISGEVVLDTETAWEDLPPEQQAAWDALAWGEEDEPTAMARGARVYSVFCVVCHGPSGGGDGSVTKRGVPPPPPFATGKAAGWSDGRLFHTITVGQGNMASYASQIERSDRWKVIRYIRTLMRP